jgi:hypothetical protein
MEARNGVVTDTHLYMMSQGKLARKRLPAPVLGAGQLLQICLDAGLDALWVLAGTQLSDIANRDYIEQALGGWDIKNHQYTDPHEYEDDIARCTFLMAWKRKEARSPEESGRAIFLGYAEHNHRWELHEVTNPVALLGALTYLEDALQRPARFTPQSTGKNMMAEVNKGERMPWVRPVDLSTYEPVIKTKVVDIRWKRPLSEREMGMGYLIGADKNSMYPASGTSVLLGSGTPIHTERPVFNLKKPLAGVYLCSVSGTSEFDGVGLPHPLQNLLHTNEGGVRRGWFWTYTVKLLHELGYTVDIEQAYTWAESHTILRPWAEQLWAARASLDGRNPACASERYPSQEARALAYRAVKPILNTSLGLLDSVPKHPERPGAFDWYRPDWYMLVKDNARYQMFWRIRSFLKKNCIPVGIHCDCLYYITDTDNHEQALPGMFDRWDKLGGYKRKFTRAITVAQVRELFNSPQEIGLLNTVLGQYDNNKIEL